MSEFYDEMRDIAQEVMSEFAQDGIKYIAVTPSNGPADDPGTPVETEYTVDAAAVPVQRRWVNGTSIIVTDSQIVMAARSDMVPDMKGFVKIGTKRYKPIDIKRLPEADTAIAWVIIFRR